jgi:hypothetical protein
LIKETVVDLQPLAANPLRASSGRTIKGDASKASRAKKTKPNQTKQTEQAEQAKQKDRPDQAEREAVGERAVAPASHRHRHQAADQ